MGIREQKIKIGYGIRSITRAVYDDRSNPDLMIQTGYVEYDNQRIPVWRPYNPEEKDLYAEWKKGVWKNIYLISMSLKENNKYISYQLATHQKEGLSISLPKVELALTYDIEEYLKKL